MSSAVSRRAVLALRPACTSLKSSTGRTSMTPRRSACRRRTGPGPARARKTRRDGRRRCPRRVCDEASNSRAMSSSFILFEFTPIRPSSSAETRPRRLGSEARSWMSGAPCANPAMARSRSGRGMNSSPSREKNGRPAMLATPMKWVLSAASFVGQGAGRLRRQLRSRRVDHRIERVEMVKRLFERLLRLPPGQIGRQHGVDVGIDLEMGGGVEGRTAR